MNLRNIKNIWLFPLMTTIIVLIAYLVNFYFMFEFHHYFHIFTFRIFGILIFPIILLVLILITVKTYKFKIKWKRASNLCVLIIFFIVIYIIAISVERYHVDQNSTYGAYWGSFGSFGFFTDPPSIISDVFIIFSLGLLLLCSVFFRISRLPVKEKIKKERYCKNCQKFIIPIKKFNVKTFLIILLFLPFLFGIPAILYIIFYRYIPKCPNCLKNRFAYDDEEIQILEGNSIPNESSNAHYCTECGTHLAEDQSFCGACGNKI